MFNREQSRIVKKQVLVVDDEKRVAESIQFFLNKEGFDVSDACCGSDAVSFIKENRVDLILLDISMPGMDGFEVLESIFHHDPDSLVVMMTGYATVESAVKALKLGAWDYLKKPFEYAELIKTVKNGITHKQLINENRAVSARLEISEMRCQYLVNNSPDLICTLNSRGKITFVNDEFENLLGYKREQLLGSYVQDIVHSDDCAKAVAAVNQVCSGGRDKMALTIRLKKACQDKKNLVCPFITVEQKVTSLYIPGGDLNQNGLKCVYCVARDITERNNLEDQLRQSQKLEAIGTLAGGIAHDFNNILMAIQGYASLVRTSFKPGSPQYKKLANVDEYVQAGSEMTRQLLGLAQKKDNALSLVNLNYLLKMSAKMFGRTKKDVMVSLNLQKDLWSVRVDEGQLKQVMLNLYVNAWQAMPEGGRIYIKSENTRVGQSLFKKIGLREPGRYIKISVVDTGVGMNNDVARKIFDPFFTTKEMEGGTGLGLATAYGIIKGHKGVIRVASREGEGSSFCFYLPALASESEKNKGIQLNEKIVNGKGTVLLVDDEQSVIDVCSEMLIALGYEVISVQKGKDALDILKQDDINIDLVILDMIMPEMSGIKVFKQIKSISPEMKVLLASGYTQKNDVEELISQSSDGFIQKPFDVARLSKRVMSCLESDMPPMP